MCCQYGHGLSFVYCGCLEICARIFIPFCYLNSANIVNLATSRVGVDCRGHLKRLIQTCLYIWMTMISIIKTMCENLGQPIFSLYIYTRTQISKSRMSFFNVFCFIESVLVKYINNVHLNKWLYLYLIGILFLEQRIFSFHLLLKGILHLRGFVRTATIYRIKSYFDILKSVYKSTLICWNKS